MNTNKNLKSILIVSYVFPPYPGIGGRRWAKFAKYLHRQGHNVYVIAAKNPFENVSTFIEDVKEIPPKNIFYLAAKYPSILLKQPKSIGEKLVYNFWIRVLPFLSKGNFYDTAALWDTQLKSKIEQIIQEKKIDTIISTGPPFNLVYQSVLLKKKYPAIKFIADYRDEWTFNDVHGFGLINEKRKKVEFEKEKYVCENADTVISCDEIILEYLSEKYKTKNMFHLPHGFDKDDFAFNVEYNNKSNDDIVITYFGTMEPKKEKFFIEMEAALNKLCIDNNELYNKLKINFFLLNTFQYTDLIKRNIHKINIVYNLNPKSLFKELVSSDYILVMLPDWVKDYFTTKYPEIFYLKKPIILYSEEGRVSQFITKHKIGIHLPQENFYHTFIEALSNPEQYNYNSFPIDDWNYEYLTQKLVSIINEL